MVLRISFSSSSGPNLLTSTTKSFRDKTGANSRSTFLLPDSYIYLTDESLHLEPLFLGLIYSVVPILRNWKCTKWVYLSGTQDLRYERVRKRQWWCSNTARQKLDNVSLVQTLLSTALNPSNTWPVLNCIFVSNNAIIEFLYLPPMGAFVSAIDIPINPA